MKTLQDSIDNLSAGHEEQIIDRETCLRSVNFAPYFKFLHRERCRKLAMAKPLPGNLLGAFMDKSIKVLDKDVCRIVPAHFFILQKIESKLLALLAQAQGGGSAKAEGSIEEDWDICWIFTNDPERIFNLVRDGGLKALREESKVVRSWDAEVIEPVILAVIEQLKRHAENKVKLISDMKKEGNLTFFPEPEQTPATNQPAMAG